MNEIKNADSLSDRPSQPKALRILATIISYIFHPVFMPTIMTIVLFQLAPASFAGVTSSNFSRMLLPVIINTLLFPLVTTLLIKGVGFIDSIHMYNSKDRIIPLIGSMIFYFWAYNVSKNMQFPLLLRTLLLGGFWGVIAVFMINIFFKISMHTAAAGSVLGILLVLMFNSPVNMAIPFFLALFIAGLVGTSRMILYAHRGGEIWLGYIVGVLVQVAAYWYLK